MSAEKLIIGLISAQAHFWKRPFDRRGSGLISIRAEIMVCCKKVTHWRRNWKRSICYISCVHTGSALTLTQDTPAEANQCVYSSWGFNLCGLHSVVCCPGHSIRFSFYWLERHMGPQFNWGRGSLIRAHPREAMKVMISISDLIQRGGNICLVFVFMHGCSLHQPNTTCILLKKLG